jgi:hypothetical protein
VRRILKRAWKKFWPPASTLAVEIHGKPESENSSVKGNEQLQLRISEFHWAGQEMAKGWEVFRGGAADKADEFAIAVTGP